MTALVTIDETSAIPPFEQVRAQLATLISTGALPPGQRLPTVRQLARDLRLAPGTIARAFRHLEQAGLVHTARTKGTVVTAPTSLLDDETLGDPRLRGLTAAYLASVRALGYQSNTIQQAVRAGLKQDT